MNDGVDFKEVLDRNICPVCGKQDCPYLSENKRAKEMMDAYRNGDMETAKKIYIKNYAQYAGMNNGLYKESIKLHDSVSQSLTRGSNSESPLNISPVFNSAINAAIAILKPSSSLVGSIFDIQSQCNSRDKGRVIRGNYWTLSRNWNWLINPFSSGWSSGIRYITWIFSE